MNMKNAYQESCLVVSNRIAEYLMSGDLENAKSLRKQREEYCERYFKECVPCERWDITNKRMKRIANIGYRKTRS